jgi:hypothetical protein
MRRKKGAVGFFLVFIFFALMLSFLFAFAIPMLIDINTHLYTAGEIALVDAAEWTENIDDAAVKAQIQDTLDSGKDSIPDQIEILGFFYQYSWLVIIVAVLFVVFMYTRMTVETSAGIR